MVVHASYTESLLKAIENGGVSIEMKPLILFHWAELNIDTKH